MSGAPARLRRLGTLPVARFVREVWQRRPLCVRGALAAFAPPIDRRRLFALAADPGVESRLVTAFDGRWRLSHGPFGRLPALGRRDWTLLVQGVDGHEAAVAALAERFRFLPAARFDDVMISYASPGGGVGPHVDQYDVFLLQAQGRRRWRIARRFDPALVEGLPLRVLARFAHEQEWVLEPGDLLYLPPGVAHEGVAVDECMTISIGFRLPALQEIVEAWGDRQARVQALAGHLRDRTRRPTATPARLPAGMEQSARRALRASLPTAPELRRTLLENLSEPKPNVVFAAPRPALSPARFRQRALAQGLRLDLRTRMLYAAADFALNGELFETAGRAAPWLRRLANEGRLEASQLARIAAAATEDFFALVHNWYCFGWIHLAAYEG